jgi:hypothetical protein
MPLLPPPAVAINRWAAFAMDRTLPGLFMAVMLQVVATDDGGDPSRYYFLDTLKRKVADGELQARRCVYDPVCSNDGGACHACVHLAETSCRFFNLNLSRAFLWGGRTIGGPEVAGGYLDASLG